MTSVADAASAVSPVLDFHSARWWATFAAVQVIAVIGYAAASLPAWARWDDGSTQDRLAIIQGVIASVLAGNIAYMLSAYAVKAPEVWSLVGAALAAYAGDAYLRPLLNRWMGSRGANGPNT